MGLPRVFIILSHLPILLATLYAIVHFKHLSKALQVFSYFLFFSCLIQFGSLILWFCHINNMPLLHIYLAIGTVLLAQFYQTLLGEYINPKILLIVAVAFLVFSSLNSIFFQSIFTFNSNALTVQSILILIVSIFTYIVSYNKIVKEKIDSESAGLNWINSGLFIYYCSNLLIFYFTASIMESLPIEYRLSTWVLHSFFSIVMYICFLVGLYKAEKK